MEDGIWGQMVELETIEVEETMKERMDGESKATQEMGNKA